MLEAGHMRIAKQAGFVQANQRLGSAVESLRRGDLDLSGDDANLREWADNKARIAKLKMERWGDEEALAWASDEAERVGLLGVIEALTESAQGELFPVVARLADRAWWLRQIRKLQLRAVDQIARDFRLVRKGSQIYASSEAVRIVQQSRRRNRKLLEALEAVNQLGDRYTLAELADKSTSKPELRRAEIMTRISGFEQVAKLYGHVALFITITCPSRFHVFSDRAVNPKHQGETVRQAHEYLMSVVARARSALARRKMRVYGIRVAEPHHDGCPHSHMLLFADPADVQGIRDVFTRWALMDSPGEPGAQKVRCKVVEIDTSKGSATGYVAKYIAKSIDGAHCGEDLYGTESGEAAGRICAWASTYGIRQFQQLGGPPVTVWRELRRMKEQEHEGLENYRTTADSGDWAAFVVMMGGPLVSRRAMPVRTLYLDSIDFETGEATLNRYGELAAKKVVGVVYCGVEFVTRVFRWVIEWAKGGGGGGFCGSLDLCQ